MKFVKIIIEKTPDHFSAYAENVEGVYGAGETPEEAKASIAKSIDLLIKNNKPEFIPPILKGSYKVTYSYDTESFLKYYKGILTLAGIEKITGINQKLIQHYATGAKKPREAQLKKIETALHKLGSELKEIELV